MSAFFFYTFQKKCCVRYLFCRICATNWKNKINSYMRRSSGGLFKSILNSMRDACNSWRLGLYVPRVARLFFTRIRKMDKRIIRSETIMASSGHNIKWYTSSFDLYWWRSGSQLIKLQSHFIESHVLLPKHISMLHSVWLTSISQFEPA